MSARSWHLNRRHILNQCTTSSLSHRLLQPVGLSWANWREAGVAPGSSVSHSAHFARERLCVINKLQEGGNDNMLLTHFLLTRRTRSTCNSPLSVLHLDWACWRAYYFPPRPPAFSLGATWSHADGCNRVHVAILQWMDLQEGHQRCMRWSHKLPGGREKLDVCQVDSRERLQVCLKHLI